MKEYKVIMCSYKELESTMNMLAEQGWIVKSVNNDGESYLRYSDFVITFERDKGSRKL